MELLLGSLLIFVLRMVDVSIASVRIVTLMRGRIGMASIMGFFESAVWVTAAALVFANLDNPVRIVAFAGGFAAGTLLGGNIERWLAMGTSMIRIVTSADPGAGGRRGGGRRCARPASRSPCSTPRGATVRCASPSWSCPGAG
jgi:hypothetical protein